MGDEVGLVRWRRTPRRCPWPWGDPLAGPRGSQRGVKMTEKKNAWVSQIFSLNTKTVFGSKRGLKWVNRHNDHLYVKLARYAHPMVGTRTPGGPI